MKKKNNLFIRITGLILFLFSLPMAIMSYVLAIDYQLKSQDDVMLFLAQDFPTLLLMTLFLIVSLFLLLYEADTFRKKGEGGTYTAMTVGTILAALLTLYLRMPVGGMTYHRRRDDLPARGEHRTGPVRALAHLADRDARVRRSYRP